MCIMHTAVVGMHSCLGKQLDLLIIPLVGCLGISPSLLMLIQIAALLKEAGLAAGSGDGLQQAAVIVVVGVC